MAVILSCLPHPDFVNQAGNFTWERKGRGKKGNKEEVDKIVLIALFFPGKFNNNFCSWKRAMRRRGLPIIGV